jgi:NADP-dependent alcohol dehydrogenase
VKFEGDPWEILTKGAPVKCAVPIGCILTLPATGSESNAFAVVSREATQEKFAFSSDYVYPQFAVLDPETTYTLPPRQVANGIVDAFAHTLEQYLTYPSGAPLQDRFAEGILLTLVETGPRTLATPTDYEQRANLMWAATMALNGLIGQGVPQDWSTHMIGHEITALRGLDHAQTLAIVFPGTMSVRRSAKREKLLQYAERIWNIRSGSDDERIDAAIQKTREFFESLGVPTRLSAYGLGGDLIQAIEERFTERGWNQLGERSDVGPKQAAAVLAYSM